MASSQFKRYRQAFGGDPSTFDPSRILTQAMQPQSTQVAPSHYNPQDGTATGAFHGPHSSPTPRDENIGDGFSQRPASFGQDLAINKGPDITPQLDMAMARGEESDQKKQQKRQRIGSMIQGGLAGAAAVAGQPMNFGEALLNSANVAMGVTKGSMDTQDERRKVEEDRQMEIENMFFTRSVKLQELAIARRKADSDENDKILDRALHSRQIDVSERRANSSEDRLTELERHNQATEEIGRTNAASSKTRATAAARKAGAKPRTATQIDEYARARVYIQFGAKNEKGQVLDQEKVTDIDDQLSRTSGRRKTRVQEAYENARREATKPTVDPNAEYDPES